MYITKGEIRVQLNDFVRFVFAVFISGGDGHDNGGLKQG